MADDVQQPTLEDLVGWLNLGDRLAGLDLGTKTIGKVQKIAGPGGPYVTAAKKVPLR